MKTRQLLSLVALTFLASCLSQKDPQAVHYFAAPQTELAGEAVPGTKPLRFDRIQSPPLLSTKMLWRVSENELAPDDLNSWALHPADMLEIRVRDLLFSRQGYRESLDPLDALLSVRVLTMEGVAFGDPSAHVLLVADFWSPGSGQHRKRFEVSEAIDSLEANDLASGMTKAIERVSAELVDWVNAKQ
jgi:ABC-type uncharacterized transport system auxiliary subunit